jgi:glycosyltransferase involved in cell wall biosynthesis
LAFTPQAPWFEHQPSTKVFEYLHFGLICIAADTTANREVIIDANGVHEHTWERVAVDRLEPVLESARKG